MLPAQIHLNFAVKMGQSVSRCCGCVMEIMTVLMAQMKKPAAVSTEQLYLML